MSFLRVALACLITTTGASVSLAQDSAPAAAAPAPTAAPADAKPAKERKICHRETDTGSIMPHMTCHTKEEWIAIDAQNRDQVDQMVAHRGSGSAGITR